MLLRYGETVLFQGPVEREHEGQRGNLVLTTARVDFEAENSHGLLGGRSTAIVLEVELEHLRDVQMSTKLVGRPVVQLQSYHRVHRFKTPQAAQWGHAIGGAHRRRPPPPPPPPPPGQTPVVVNVHSAATSRSVFLHCRYCGAMNPAGSDAHCGSCGATL